MVFVVEVVEGVVVVVVIVVVKVVEVVEVEVDVNGQAMDSSPMFAAANLISKRVLALSFSGVPVGRP